MLLADGGLMGTVETGPFLIAAAVAVLVGLIGFLSPCVLPLVPGYLSYVAGLAGDGEQPSQRRMLAGAGLFVLGFTAIFVVVRTTLFGEFGFSVKEHQDVIERVFGVITIVLGVVFLGGIGFLQRELKIHRLPRAGLLGAPLLGLGFGLAWTPCLTPTFSAILALSVSDGSQGRGTVLVILYCLGLGIPFLLVAAGFGWVSGALSFVRRHRRAVSVVGGALLIVIGVLLVTGVWGDLMTTLQTNVPQDAGVQV